MPFLANLHARHLGSLHVQRITGEYRGFMTTEVRTEAERASNASSGTLTLAIGRRYLNLPLPVSPAEQEQVQRDLEPSRREPIEAFVAQGYLPGQDRLFERGRVYGSDNKIVYAYVSAYDGTQRRIATELEFNAALRTRVFEPLFGPESRTRFATVALADRL